MRNSGAPSSATGHLDRLLPTTACRLRLQALETASVSQDICGERLSLRGIRDADELCVLPSVASREYGVYDPFGPQGAEAARLNITETLSALDWWLGGHAMISPDMSGRINSAGSD